ncbi:class I SAM-dependent RNA methyltransferase [Flaviflexus massiliensis]|uniref:class I SAM-dependent RNA methyltransferase n=1 Tax=Flaviflexus massiliensis TaxID=1522309 RepID=UPI0011C8F8A6|nr:class I SAM-dependent RNA methyltransferase [Flaviflexus massiliensis]
MKRELVAGSPVHGGYTLARDEGRIILVTGAAPGERVEVDIDDSQKTWTGTVTKVLEPSTDRVDHVWDVAGGAELGYLKRAAQLEWKTAVLEDCINHLGGGLGDHLKERGLGINVREVGPGLGTRTRLDLDVNDEGRLAMHAYASNDLVAIENMPLATDAINAIITGQDDWAGTWKPGDRVRIVDPSGQGTVVAVGKDVYRAPGEKTSPRVLERAAGYSWEVTATGFWQTHEKAPVTLLDAVLKGVRLRSTDRVAEFYGGAGFFTLPLTDQARAVRMWEGNAVAVRDAKRNAPNARIAQAAINPKVLAEGAKGSDVVIADPSRAGLGIPGATAIAKSDTQAIALVSCDPAAMARDVRAMVEAGRQVMSLASFDLFPHTSHLEVVTVLA